MILAFSLLFWVCFCRSFLSFVFTGNVSPFSICCKAGLVVLNSLNLCLSIKVLISPSILNEVFARYSNHGCRFFSFSTLNIWRRKWQPTPVFLPGESHGQRSLVSYSPWGHTELDMTEVIEHTLMHFKYILPFLYGM